MEGFEGRRDRIAGDFEQSLWWLYGEWSLGGHAWTKGELEAVLLQAGKDGGQSHQGRKGAIHQCPSGRIPEQTCSSLEASVSEGHS